MAGAGDLMRGHNGVVKRNAINDLLEHLSDVRPSFRWNLEEKCPDLVTFLLRNVTIDLSKKNCKKWKIEKKHIDIDTKIWSFPKKRRGKIMKEKKCDTKGGGFIGDIKGGEFNCHPKILVKQKRGV